MTKFKSFTLTTILGFTLFTSCAGQDSQSIFDLSRVKEGPVVVQINGQDIHQGFLDLLVDLNPRIKTQLANPITKKKILNSLVDQQLLFQEALKRNVHTRADVSAKMLLNKHVIMANSLIETELEKEMKKEYESRKDKQFTKIEVALLGSHFKTKKDTKGKKDVTTEQKEAALKKAMAMKARLDKGDSFATVSKEDSDDRMTNKKGGVAGQISKEDRRFARLGLSKVTDAAFKLKKGQVSGPIETKKGYYIVKVLSDPQTLPFDDAQKALRFELQNRIKKVLIDELRKDAKIKFASASDAKASTPASTAGKKANPKVKADVKIGQPKATKKSHDGHNHQH